MHQRIVALARFHDDIAAPATIAAGGASARDDLLPAEGETAVAAIASFHPDCGLVDEHGKQPSAIRKIVVGRASVVVRRWPWPRRRSSAFSRRQADFTAV